MTVEPTTQPKLDTVSVTIDGYQVSVPKGTLVIRAAELIGISIPRFCDHPLLDPIGACRQCLVDIEGQRKPLASCTTVCTDGMVVKTQFTSPVADKAQQGVMELLLINHPLDCPMCDKGGECPLQNQAMSNGRGESRFREPKREFDKPVAISSQVLLDRERCISCTRCVRASEEIAGDDFIEFLERGPRQYIGTANGKPFNSYFSGNTVQVCPVGALTGAAYRFKSRPFDLVSTPGICEHCASGCHLRTDHRRGKVMRRLAGDEPLVNEEWNCDKGRWAFNYATEPDRLTTPLVRDTEGVLRPASWATAYAAAARGLAAARDAGAAGGPGGSDGPAGVGVLTGGRLTLEDAYAYAKFARLALNTNDIDMRARAHSAEEEQFLAARVAGRGIEVSYADLEAAPAVLLAGFEPEDESPIVFLRLRKAARKAGLKVFSAAALASPGLEKVFGTLLPTVPGAEPATLTALAAGGGSDPDIAAAADLLAAPGAVILVGERLAEVPGALAAAVRLADASGAKLAWIPRRAGERGAVEAGALPGLLPIGRWVGDPKARAEVALAWNKASLPATPGRSTSALLAAAEAGELGAFVIAGVEVADLPDPAAALRALDRTPFIVSLELRASDVTDRADVVFPVAAVAEKAGTFVNWEGRGGSFAAAIAVPGVRTDLYVLAAIAEELDVHLGLPDAAAARAELAALGAWQGARPAPPAVLPSDSGGEQGLLASAVDRVTSAASRVASAIGHLTEGPEPAADVDLRLATWHQLIDAGRMQDGEPYLAGTARPAVARVSAATAAEAGLADGDKVTVSAVAGSTGAGSLTVPLAVTDMADGVVWLPANSPGSAVRTDLGAGHGSTVTLRRAE
jgi:NADH-quinone oxidoreductase subunit G